MPRYTTNSKQVLRDGKHFADCIDDGAARLVADSLNERRGMPQTQQVLPLDGADGPLFGDLHWVPVDMPNIHYKVVDLDAPGVCRYPNVRQENDEYACSCGARWDVADGENHP